MPPSTTLFRPIDLMRDRLSCSKGGSDTDCFLTLLYFGELVTKLVTVSIVSALVDDVERHRYRLSHRLVHADGLGEWPAVLDDALIGPASQHLVTAAHAEQKEITQRTDPGAWQFEAVKRLHECVRIVDPTVEPLPLKLDLRKWFVLFAFLRNRTRGHGAPMSGACAELAQNLEDSLNLVVDNHQLFKRPWAYLHRNLSGKYRVVSLSTKTGDFEYLKSTASENLPDGVYIHLGGPIRVDLLFSSVDATDYLLPNGNFRSKTFETLSYITGTVRTVDGTPYTAPASALPPSETQGLGVLEVVGNTFANLPPLREGYIQRPQLEAAARELLFDDRHAIITLAGRGGIGKTWLALSVLHRIATTERYAAIVWLSARDIDLLPGGAKVVQPRVLSIQDMARDFARLLSVETDRSGGSSAEAIFGRWLGESPVGPVLVVIDNFETVRSPAELYLWLDTYVRNPNKVLITTRTREFRGDYPLQIMGMTEPETDSLVDDVARRLGITDLITHEYRHELYREAEGHPYVTRILLGEVARARRVVSVERIMAGQDDILDALFERTFAALSPTAKRVFLTLCAWRVSLPSVAVEAVLLREANDRMDVEAGLAELVQLSLVESVVSQEDGMPFVAVPLAAAVFGKRKLSVSPMKSAVEADVELLRVFGAGRITDVRHGIGPRIRRLFKSVAVKAGTDNQSVDRDVPMLEFIARRYSPAWTLLGYLFEEMDRKEDAKRAFRAYLEVSPSGHEADQVWTKLYGLCEATDDQLGMVHALVEVSELPDLAFGVVSDAANRVNELLSRHTLTLDVQEKRIILRRLARVLDIRIAEAGAADLSRLAWLYLHLHEQDKAREITARGLGLEPDNRHLLNLAERLAVGTTLA